MTAAQLTKMQEGRARQLVELHEQHMVALDAFREWISLESDLYRDRLRAERSFGRDSDEFFAANDAWRDAWRNQPTPPPDYVFRAARGESS